MSRAQPIPEFKREEVLMVVKTYPSPSTKYGEIVCTAGIRLRDREWVRIYPYEFRLRSKSQRFRKWQIVELGLLRNTGDPRPESYKPFDLATIQHKGFIPTTNNWSARMPYVRQSAFPDVKTFQDQMISKVDGTWGATIRPVPVMPGAKLIVEEGKREWSKEELKKLTDGESRLRMDLFADSEVVEYFKQLKPVPYKFKLRYQDLSGTYYTHRIQDWEIGELYWKCLRLSYGDEIKAVEKVRQKIEDEIFSPTKEVFLILGNYFHQYKNADMIAVVGFVWPKRTQGPVAIQDNLL